MKNTIEIKLVKSLIGRVPKHKEIAHVLGLKKINASVVKPNNKAILGMIAKIHYLVECKESTK